MRLPYKYTCGLVDLDYCVRLDCYHHITRVILAIEAFLGVSHYGIDRRISSKRNASNQYPTSYHHTHSDKFVIVTLI